MVKSIKHTYSRKNLRHSRKNVRNSRKNLRNSRKNLRKTIKGGTIIKKFVK